LAFFAFFPVLSFFAAMLAPPDRRAVWVDYFTREPYPLGGVVKLACTGA
jgi:hypothetical protein